ncbi:penicillin-binding protein [Parabacteroides sp. 52]|uniref:transglycosylase domain-containing protein n=1 Tax=unclassified Parabacteroides TaxID=2649774 RepID=UPI0013D2ADB5|nr:MULTISPECIES: transglycosylase domain-containing protein [unclassified Parabacteroides]MDH6534016.1 penicillin-binding protein 1A [Parabacteroides sp. PM5-20]NDV54757.1 penicillin-binding protein [Parabacteroides sp. 52]
MASKVKKIIFISAWTLYAALLIIVALIFVAISKGSIGYMPPVEQLENPIDKYASQIISVDGKTLGSFGLSMDNRIRVNYEDLSPDLVNALIATEDIRFSQHSGIDVIGLFRAIVKRGILFQKSGGGGSTITQQLAKQLYSPNADNFIERIFQKPIEWVIAVQLERFYTKEEIINLYLNKFDFLYNAVGIQSASRVYFGKTPQSLKIEEAATLVGMCKNPSLYNPVRHNERTRGRRNVVFEQMYKADYLSRATCDSLKALPLTVHFTRMDHKDGLAPYYREYLRMALTAKKPVRSKYASWQAQKFKEDSLAWETNPLYGWCNKNKKSDGDYYNIYTDGLKIYSTIDSRMQQYAEEAVREHIGGDLQPLFTKEKKGRTYAPFSKDLRLGQVDTILMRAMHQTDRYRALKKEGLKEEAIREEFKKPVDMRVFSWKGPIDTIMSPWDSIRYHKSFLRTAFMSMDTRTGHVKAYVGGIDYNYFQYDMVNGGRRQIGSTIKPYLYSLAMIEGISPCERMLHVKQSLRDENGKLWEPQNSSPKNVGEMVTIQWGLQNSSNWVTAYLINKLSPYTFVRLLHSFGLNNQMDPVVAIALGTPDVSVGEMVTGYSTFANNGIRVDPLYVTRIEDSYGNTIASFSTQMNEVLTEDASYKMLHMLKGVVDQGTGTRIRFRYGIKAEMGGKTGTTQNNSDGWFMAFTPSLVAGCWVGGEDRSIHFDRLTEGQGASMALPVYGLFMQKVYADKTLGYSEEETFIIPPQYADPCEESSPENHEGTTTGAMGIDRMFE